MWLVQGQVRGVVADHASRLDSAITDTDRAAANRALEAMMGNEKN